MYSSLDDLSALESTDSVVQTVAKNVRTIVSELEIDKQIPGLQIYFPDFSNADFGDAKPIYYTEGCLSILPSTVVVNAQFLLDTEAAIRSFGMFNVLLKTPYLRSDACMFGLVKRIRDDGKVWLEKLRQFEDKLNSPERSAIDELTLTALFFCTHEIGHLLDNVSDGQYAAFLDPKKPLETRLANAAVKLRRHVSEFEGYGFDLPGWEFVLKSEHEVFAEAERLRSLMPEKDKDADENNADWFKKEISADDTAVRLMTRHLKNQPPKYRWLLVRGLFAAALYSWYADLLVFCERMDVPRMGTKPMLSFELMKNKRAYINAASLFGDVHRCTILRSTLGIQSIVNAGEKNGGNDAATNNGETLLSRATALWDRLFGAKEAADGADEQFWKKESAYRHLLLAIHMDTVVKLAYVGATMPWMMKKDDERGFPQIFFMTFESIDQSVGRLRKMIGMN